MTTFSHRQINKVARRLQLRDHSLLLVRAGTPLAETETLERLSAALGATGLHDVLLVVVDNLDDLRLLPKDQLHQAGWFRLPERNTQS